MDNTEISIVPFKFKHFSLLTEMLSNRNYSQTLPITYKSLPRIGYICLMNKYPIAAGFLRRVEGDIVGQMDTFVSNTNYGSIIRHQALSKIVDNLIQDAKDLKLQGLIAFTTDNGILSRAQTIGFIQLNHKIMSLTF